MQTGTILHRKGGTFPPNELLLKILAANTNGWGAAMITKEGDKTFLQINSDPTGCDLEFFQTTCKDYMDCDITWYFCESAAALNQTDIAPYPLIYKDDEPQLVAFFDGNFPGSEQKDSSHPPEHFLAQRLSEKVTTIYDALDEDLETLIINMKREKFSKELLLNATSRGVITFMAANGEAWTVEINNKSAEYPWGWVSNTHGYVSEGEKKAEKPKTAFPSRSTVRERVVPAASTAQKSEAAAPPKTETAIIKNYTTLKKKPPEGLSRKNTKNWYKQQIGFLPKGWEDKVAIDVMVSPEGKVMSLRDIKDLGSKGLEVMTMLKSKNPTQVTDLEPDNIEQPEVTGPTEPLVTAEILPIMPPAAKVKAQAYLKDARIQKIIAENADIITDPSKYQAIEAKFADIGRQLGYTSNEDFKKWSYGMMLETARDNPELSAQYGFYFRNRSLRLEFEIAELKAKAAEPEVKAQEKPRVAFPSRKAAAA